MSEKQLHEPTRAIEVAEDGFAVRSTKALCRHEKSDHLVVVMKPLGYFRVCTVICYVPAFPVGWPGNRPTEFGVIGNAAPASAFKTKDDPITLIERRTHANRRQLNFRVVELVKDPCRKRIFNKILYGLPEN